MAEQTKLQKAQIEWGEFPQFEKLVRQGETELLQKVEATCRRLDELSRNGNPQDQVRAKAAMTAYGRTLDLLQKLNEARDRIIAEQAAGR